ncbi:MAG: alcohol dehydrogenase catalytic domain-containing protein [Spirochaetales bacterium]|jgi:L-iditol 2-dehydrogenase|nr:alcohol dehydrogenase catalytic domain-containing protein [Spirochaetales bacterium]
MKAVFIEQPYKVKFINAPEPVIKNPDEVKIHIAFTGICGSEVHAYKGTHPTRLPPIISGHESSGVISEIGCAVKDFKVGDRVIIEPQKACGKCPDCLRGDYNVCPEKAVLGTIKWQGSFGEYIVAPERSVLHLPDCIPMEEGALAEPLAVAAHAVRISSVGLGRSVLIQGCGPIGISLLAMCRRAGAGKIIMTDVSLYNMDAAKLMGADVLINAQKQDVVKEVLTETGGAGAEVVFMAIGNAEILDQAVQCTRRYGQIMEVAHFGSEPPFDARNYRWKELAMQGSYMFVRKDFEIVIAALASGQINVKPMISKILPVEDCAAVMKMAHDRSEDFVKILFQF